MTDMIWAQIASVQSPEEFGEYTHYIFTSMSGEVIFNQSFGDIPVAEDNIPDASKEAKVQIPMRAAQEVIDYYNRRR